MSTKTAGKVLFSELTFEDTFIPLGLAIDTPIARPRPPPSLAPATAFDIVNDNGTWWLVNPDGKPFYARGTHGPSWTGGDNVAADFFASLLQSGKFNVLGGWSSIWRWREANRDVLIPRGDEPLYVFQTDNLSNGSTDYTYLENALGENTGASGHWFADPFDPNFATYLNTEYAGNFSLVENTSWFVGWSPDNEASHEDLQRYVYSLHASQAFKAFLSTQYGADIAALNTAWSTSFTSFDDILVQKPDPEVTTGPMYEDFQAFAEEIVREYVRVMADAIRANDPQHLVFSPQLALGDFTGWQRYLEIYAQPFDAIMVNMYAGNADYGLSTDFIDVLDEIHLRTGKPIVITEWSVPALDSGLYDDAPNMDFSWKKAVATQSQRAEHARAITYDYYDLPYVIGTHWFKWQDYNDANRRANRGLADSADNVYQTLWDQLSVAHTAMALHETPSVINPPTAVTAVAISASTIDLSWVDNSSTESGFTIERSADGVSAWVQVGTVGADVSVYSDPGLSAGTTYYYRVKATSGAGDSIYSNTANATTAQIIHTDPTTIWPLCGRITANPPTGWVDTDGCPAVRFGDASYSDEPLSATFGPRPLASESNRYDFHRGVDIATATGTPFFAISDGRVDIAGSNASYSDPLVKLRHFRPGETSCSAGGCYYSFYLHISSWVVNATEQVVKGQLLGYTGASASGFEHVHFEVRDAPDFDVNSAWSRDAIHPLSVVPYAAANNTSILFNNVDFSTPGAGIVDLALTSNRFDLVSFDLKLFDSSHQQLLQDGDTPDANGYYVQPPFFDMELWNFQYSHKDSTAFTWESFGSGGVNQCPFNADHGPSYNANVHMDQQDASNPLEGLFNGLHVRTQKYWPSDVDNYQIQLEFQLLQGAAACVEATAFFASGDTGTGSWGNCSGVPGPASLTRGPYLQMQTENGITIHWRTDTGTDSVVRYGTSAGNLSSMVTVTGSRTEHKVSLNGLGSGQHFWYSVGDSTAAIAGDASYHFYTAPATGPATDTRIWVIGDSGTANSNARAVRDAYKTFASSNPANLWLMLGDNAYNTGTDAEYQSAVFNTYPEILRQLPLWSTIGNHDGQSADSGTQSGPYYDIFNLPANAEIGGWASGTEAYYSFDYANIHFVCLDSYDTDRAVNGLMMQWLESDLALNNQPWVIAFWHHPPYTKGSHNSDTEGALIDMRENALPILEAWGVDLVMTGHSHVYERSYLLDGHYGASTTLDPVANVLNPGDGSALGDGVYEKPEEIAAMHAGSVYTVTGSSGQVSSNGSLDHPAMFVSLRTLGSLLLDVTGNRMDVTFIDDSGSVLDEFSIAKTPDIEPPLITAASAEDASHVLVDFNEVLDSVEATTLGNYTIAGLSISQVELLTGDHRVRLTTSAMSDGVNYTLVVNNLQDLAGNIILPNSQVNFSFFARMTVSFQDGLLPDPTYSGTNDAYIREASPTTVHGLETTLQMDGDEPSSTAQDMNILVGWDISSIPTNAIVESAQIQLEVTNISGNPYTCNSLLTDWDQSQVTWNEAITGSPWGAPGATSATDRANQVVCAVNAGSNGPLTVNLVADGLALVQSWVSNPTGNHGIVIGDSTNSNGADFHSSESATAMARPLLQVTYHLQVVGCNGGSYSVVDNQWQIVSLPCDPGINNTVTDVFGDDLNGTYGTDWGLWEFDASAGTSGSYNFLSGSSIVSPGTGYWLIKVNGAGTWSMETTDAINVEPFEIPLIAAHNGTTGQQNMVGNPTTTTLAWKDIKVLDSFGNCYGSPSIAAAAGANGLISGSINYYNGSGYTVCDDTGTNPPCEIAAGEGFWVKVPDNSESNARLKIGGACQSGSEVAAYKGTKTTIEKQTASEAWAVYLKVKSGPLEDPVNTLGQRANASIGYDRNDLKELVPDRAPYMTLVFPHPDWGDKAGDYGADYQPLDGAKTSEWHFVVHTSELLEELTLSWQAPKDILKNSQLVDEDTGKKIKLKKLQSYTTEWYGLQERHFKWILKPKKAK